MKAYEGICVLKRDHQNEAKGNKGRYCDKMVDKFIWPIKMGYKAGKFEMNESLCF